MKKISKMSKRTTALMVAAILLLLGGAVGGTRAALNIQSDIYRAHFYLNHLQVHLIENGADVCGGVNNLDGSAKVTGKLATSLGYESISNPGTVEPGKTYKEEIQAENGNNIDEFVRLTIRKYWVKTDEDGNIQTEPDPDKNGEFIPVKESNMNPAWIHLTYKGSEDGNTSAWVENKSEATDESRTFYYRTDLDADARSELLFDQIMIDKELVKLGKINETKEGNKTIYTYEYKYDGAAFFIEADVQAIQTHNVNEAIKSQWGVDNVTGSFTDTDNLGHGSGTLSVN